MDHIAAGRFVRQLTGKWSAANPDAGNPITMVEVRSPSRGWDPFDIGPCGLDSTAYKKTMIDPVDDLTSRDQKAQS
ncbi:hypothetical protein RGCCGE502_21605 [Rhizobium grahamii CCGE 502]|uniref:Uncharacterized protein n=1 Tax=Rhizobium grahamii CCGE 502 TaxID=990285 RepID=S3HBZ1_9HYPH|nr:hypothetical protein RGCCGE502_21605 [Rhizobium grahamii CCGE 502]